jgi:hypothetical protein
LCLQSTRRPKWERKSTPMRVGLLGAECCHMIGEVPDLLQKCVGVRVAQCSRAPAGVRPRRCWISCFGCPQTITTDQGRQLESQFFNSLARLCGSHLSRTTSHHPASNAPIELFTGR